MHTRYIAILICQILLVVAKITAAPLQLRDIAKGGLVPRHANAGLPIVLKRDLDDDNTSSTTSTIQTTDPTSSPVTVAEVSKDSDIEQKGYWRGNGWRGGGGGGNGWGNGNGCGGNWRRDASYWHRGYGRGNGWNGGGGCYSSSAGRVLPILSNVLLMMMVVGCLIGVGALLQ